MSLRSSGTCCAARGCTNNQTKLKLWLERPCFDHAPRTKRDCPCVKLYAFHRLPKEEEARRMWLKNLNLKKPPKTLYVCSFHFVDKKPTEENPSPTLWLGDDKPPEKRRRVLKRIDSAARRTSDGHDEMEMAEEPSSASAHSCDAGTQWADPGKEDHTYSKGIIITCRMSTSSPELSQSVADSILQSDADSLLYTGIPLGEFHTLVSCLQPFAPAISSMSVVDQILVTLMKLRQNFVMADLARRFKTSQSRVSKIVRRWIDVMSEHVKDLILWLPRKTIKVTLPQAFQEQFSNTTCVVVCVETVLQKAKSLDSRRELYGHYYANNTAKYLVAVSPSGIIMFISDAYDGKCSDRYIMQNSGFLDCLCAGDEVMGGRGFTVRDLLARRGANFIVPAFKRKGSQLTNEEVTRTRHIAHARIRVERAIRHLKAYKILSQTLPINLVPYIHKILKICAGLVNIRGELFKSEK